MSKEMEIRKVLQTVIDPLTHKDIVGANLIQGLNVTPQGQVNIVLDVNTEYMKAGAELKETIVKKLKSLEGVTDVQVILTAQRKPKAHNPSKLPIPNIKHIIAVGSGKGGVGKSTIAVNLACAMTTMGLRVGLLDADIYGPSIPRLVGSQEKPTSDNNKTINPITIHNLKTISMGFMMAENTPAIWRGPMVQTAFLQMLRQVNWGDLDILVIDLPPGTGDIQLTLVQNVLLSGVIIVSTPQDLALVDARRGLEMFRSVDVPILGLIENMSYFECPHCSGRSEIFHHGNVRAEAKAIGVPLLCEIPLRMNIREVSEIGQPLVYSYPHSKESEIFNTLSKNVWKKINSKLL